MRDHPGRAYVSKWVQPCCLPHFSIISILSCHNFLFLPVTINRLRDLVLGLVITLDTIQPWYLSFLSSLHRFWARVSDSGGGAGL
jgi:hypothetical protein